MMSFKRTSNSAVCVLILSMSLAGVAPAQPFAGGTGTPDDPFEIASAGQLISIGSNPNYLDKHFILMADIDLNPQDPGNKIFDEPIIAGYQCLEYLSSGECESTHFDHRQNYGDVSFSGTFDGNGHIIRNLVIRCENKVCVGLFGVIGEAGRVLNLGVESVSCKYSTSKPPNINTELSQDIDLYDMEVEYIGGLAGYNNGKVVGCYARGKITGKEYPDAGGLIGGLVGCNSGDVIGCYSQVKISGRDCAGGLVGRNTGLIIASYASGALDGSGLLGGLVGWTEDASVHLCYWDEDLTGQTTSAGGRGLTTEQMKESTSFRGWAHEGAWKIDKGMNPPRLIWEDAPGELLEEELTHYSGGAGDANAPYRISHAQDLIALAYNRFDFDKHYIQTNDIDLTPTDCNGLIPIGSHLLPFAGVYDGNSSAIRDLSFNDKTQSNVGLFGCIGDPETMPRAHKWYLHCDIDQRTYRVGIRGNPPVLSGNKHKGLVRNLVLESAVISGDEFVGGIVGSCYGQVHSCLVVGNVKGNAGIGGVAGRLLGGRLTDCEARTATQGNCVVGGITGASIGGIIESCIYEGSVTGFYTAGGLAGMCYLDTSISKCKTQTAVLGRGNIGGLVGKTFKSSVDTSIATGTVECSTDGGGFIGDSRDSMISDCYSSTDVFGGRSDIGGFVGRSREDNITHCYSHGYVGPVSPDTDGNYSGFIGSDGIRGPRHTPNIVACFWDMETSEQIVGIRFEGLGQVDVQGRTTAEMQQEETFTGAEWDFAETWMICEGHDYPRLQWEHVDCNE